MRALISVALLLASTASIAAPMDVTPSAMLDQGGVPVYDSTATGAAYTQVLRELGTIVGSPSLAPPTTTGATGFEIAIEGVGAATDLYGRSQRYTTDPSPWDRVLTGEKAPTLQWAPGIAIRKGLPFSVELGLRGRWIAQSNQGIIGGSLRGAIIEGRRKWPDLGLHLDYDGLIGNAELKMGVASLGIGFGGSFTPGKEGHARAATIRPYIDASLLMVHASPLVSDATATRLGLSSYGAASPSPEVIPRLKALVMPRFSAGLQVDFTHVMLRLSGSYTLHSLPQFAFAIGFRG